MLPLWIIDLTQNADRQGAFKNRLGQVKGALVDEENVQKFLAAYETADGKDHAAECVWYYSHFKNPFVENELFSEDVNFAFSPDRHFDWETYIQTPSESEKDIDQKIKDLAERDRKYRLDMLRTLYRDYQEFVVEKGQSLMELLSKSMSKAKEEAVANGEFISAKEVADSLYNKIQDKLQIEESEFLSLLEKVQECAQDKVNVDAKIIAETHARAIRDRQLAFHKEKFENLYKRFRDKVDAEAVKFKEELTNSSKTVEGVASQMYLGAVDEVDSAYNKGLLDSLYQDFQNTVVKESKSFMELLTKEITDAQTNVVAIEEREADYHRHIAKVLYEDFQEKVVKEGQRFIDIVRRTRIHACSTFNICVIGDAGEAFSQLVFPSVAVMLQKEKGRILPDHIHQGMSILGAFFVPADINAQEVGVRNKVRRTMEEIDVQHKITTVRGYDRMLLYQDVQNRTENFYSLLNTADLADYLLQCLVSLYYACNEVHPLLTGSVSDEKFYFSMGPSALFYDIAVQDKLDRHTVAKGLFEDFLKDGDMNETDPAARFFTAADYLDRVLGRDSNGPTKGKNEDISPYVRMAPHVDPMAIINCFEKFEIDIESLKDPEPRRNPVTNLFHRRLETDYYLTELRQFPTELKFRINKLIEGCSSDIMEQCSRIRANMTKDFVTKTFPTAIKEMIRTCDKNTGGLCRLEKNVEGLKKNLGEFQRNIDSALEQKVWREMIIDPLNGRPSKVPSNMVDAFEEYHDCYVQDLKNPGKSTSCEDQRKLAMDVLVDDLKAETPLTSRIARVFLQSLITVIWGIPLLNMLSPRFFDWGRIYDNVVPWTILLFMLPVVFQGIRIHIQGLIRKRKIRKLKAIYLHDAYARLVNRAYSEIYKFYDSCQELCTLYLNRFKNIRDQVRFKLDENDNRELPQTRFCQDLVGGSFRGETIMGRNEIADGVIRIQHSMKRAITQLTRDDNFSLIRGYYSTLNQLMYGIRLFEEQSHHYDDEKQMEVFDSKITQIEEDRKNWEEKIIPGFEAALQNNVQKDILPRDSSTVGEKIMEYYDKYVDDNTKNAASMLLPFVRFSAPNGEFTSTADVEIADVKSNSPRVEDLLGGLLTKNMIFQNASSDAIYSRYLFLTRWRTFDFIHLNRVLPVEDFDDGTRSIRVSEVNDDRCSREKCLPSSLFLLSLCQTEKSRGTEWYRLFPERIPSSLVFSNMKAYQDVLNVDD